MLNSNTVSNSMFLSTNNDSRLHGEFFAIGNSIRLHRIFEELINSNNNESVTSQEIAVWNSNGTSVTFSKLNQRANRLARLLGQLLRNHGVSHSQTSATPTIAIFMLASSDRIMMQLACFKLGLAYLSLDLQLPETSLRYIINNGKPLCIVVDSECFSVRQNSLQKMDHSMLIFYDDLYNLAKERSTSSDNLTIAEMFLPTAPTADPDALLLYTSGSTGVPKGVRLSHKNIYNRLAWQWSCLPYEDFDIVCHKTSFLFVDSFTELFSGLLRGTPVVIARREDVKHISRFIQVVNQYCVSWIVVVPSQLKMWLTEFEDHPCLVEKLLSLRTVIVSGELLSVSLARQFFRAFPQGKRLINLYGSTEITGDVAYQIFNSISDVNSMMKDNCLPVGKPVFNTELYILKEDLSCAPLSEDGEICVSGRNVSNQQCVEALSRINSKKNPPHSQFVQNTVGYKPGFEVMHRTGDVGFIYQNRLYIRGRLDSQIKILGNRFNSAEVDNIVIHHPAVASCITLCILVNEKYHVVCFYSSKDCNNVEPFELKELVNRRLPTYVKPIFFQLEKIPLLRSNSKIDRNKLRKFYIAMLNNTSETKISNSYEISSSSSIDESDKTNRKEQIRSVLAERLGRPVSELNDGDNFFDLGADSLTVVLCVSQLRKLGFTICRQTFTSVSSIQDIITVVDSGVRLMHTSEQPRLLYTVHDMTMDDVDVVHLTAQCFCERDQVSKILGLSYEELAGLVEDERPAAVASEVSQIVKLRTGDVDTIVGVSICAERKDEDDAIIDDAIRGTKMMPKLPSNNSTMLLSPSFELLFSFFNHLSIHSPSLLPRQHLVRKWSEADEKLCRAACNEKVLYNYMLATDTSLNGRQMLEITELLEMNVIMKARSSGYTQIHSISTNAVTKDICQELGYEVIRTASLREYAVDHDKEHLLVNETEDVTGTFMIKYLD